ncbi:putative NEDD8-activating enzyme E1 regulatory subunit-like isoform X1 [Capsicum annuum]|nr:putative NEDD8-activating enzyme E1 regulatory subunit-like isoform X1 [Capsicum annuum]
MEIGLAVGGAFLSSALNVLFDRLAPHGDLLNMFRKNKHDVRLLKKLKTTLVGLQAVLSDAENKQASNQYVNQWLNELRGAVDSAENLMEQVNYEALRLKVEGRHQNLAETSNQQVSDLSLSLSDDYFLDIKEKLEETIETLEDLQKQIGDLGLQKHLDLGKKLETRTPSTSLVDESKILGRMIEKERLIDRLLSSDSNGENLTIVPIVGMGGVGKTTLAKIVYNDKKVTGHFGLKAWFCVSEAYDAFRITKGLLQEIGSFDLKDDNNLNQLQVKLKESLKGKRFLVVLDDLWNDDSNEWDDLRNVFVEGAMGSKIIVTTRKESVALMMGSGEINVRTLSDEASWALFRRHSLENRDPPKEYPELEEVGKQIADKCKGLPLALKTLAGFLRSKSEVDEWTDILRSEIWELPHHPNGILPALMLSYNDLPAHLKQCFAFCAIYPKDYQFCKEQVIFLWIANGLVQQLHSGNQYFKELRSRSLFERVPESSERYGGKFLMHDLVNDLAQNASSKLCVRLEDCQGSHMLEQSRHLSYSMGEGGDFKKLNRLSKSEQLRTLLPIQIQSLFHPRLSKRVLHNILPRLTSLRALSLSRYEIVELPDALFIKLKLLRFLDLSRTEIKKLPDSICALYNLETLILSSCTNLEELPLQMENLINLCHLDISDTSLLKMPLHLSKLKSLQVLVGAKFLLGGWRMEDLGEASYLYGSLSVLELENVVDRREAQKAKMRDEKKNHVEKLSLEWSGSDADTAQTERDILDELCPHTNIKELQISGYRGTQFPNWLADHSFLKLLVRLSLSYCKDCFSLPALGQLPRLKFLSIRKMHRITEVMEEFYGSSSSNKPFNSLEKLEFAEMPEWKQWHVLGKGEFPALRNLSIDDCPKLVGKLPENLCSLTKLRIRRCPELNLETPIQLSSLKWFTVTDSPKAGVVFDEAKLFTSQLEGMKQIEELYISDCISLASLPTSTLPSTLKKIRIESCQKLKLEAPDSSKMNSNMFLEELELGECDSISSPELVSRARYLRVVRCQNLTRFLIPNRTERLYICCCENLEILLSSVACGTQMTSLSIEDCKKLKRLPERMQELLPSLKELQLFNCPEMESFPDGGLPFNLQILDIWDCEKLVNGRKEWRLQRLLSLRELYIFHNGSDEEIVGGENWELPCSIRILFIGNLKTLSSQVLNSLTSLESLRTFNLLQVQSLLEEGLPSSLSELYLCDHDELHSLPTEGLQHLTSLQSLDISNCHQLQSLPESALPSSLSELTIWKCPNLQSLPVKGMPSSLSKLSIYNCPLLEPLIKFDKGEYWPKIAHIPEIYTGVSIGDCECL